MQHNIENTNNTTVDLEHMVNATYGLCILALWPKSKFTELVVKTTKDKIRSFLRSYPDPYLKYVELIQRILLTKEYIRLNGNSNFEELPCRWFVTPEGFTISQIWFRALEKKRRMEPLYKLEWKAVAEAFLELTIELDQSLISYWIEWFNKRRATLEHRLLINFINTLKSMQ